MTSWDSYEDVSAHLLDLIKKDLKLSSVEGKQKLIGNDSNTEWEIDAKGIRDEDDAIVVIECRRYTTKRQSQENMAALAYRISDIGAGGGIIVSPLGLQKGAKKVAAANNIVSVEIDANCTPKNFTMRVFNKLYAGFTISYGIEATAEAIVEKSCRTCNSRFMQIHSEKECDRCSA